MQETSPQNAIPAAPLLAYDDLPTGADLRRTYSGDGVSITVGGSAPSEHARRDARRRAAGQAAVATALVLIIAGGYVAALLPSDVRLRVRIENLPFIIYPLAAVFCAALYLLVWQQACARFYGHLAVAARQMTTLTADSTGLHVRGTGPLGGITFDWPAADIRRIYCGKRPGEAGKRVQSLRWLIIQRSDGYACHVLCASVVEVQWIARTLQHSLRVPG